MKKSEIKAKIKEAIDRIYEEYFIECEKTMEEEFGITLEYLRYKGSKRPLPYLRAIYAKHLYNVGVPITIISSRLAMNHSTLVLWNKKYFNYEKYNEEFKLLSDRFNNRLKEKEKENG